MGSSWLDRPCFSRLSKNGLTEKERNMPFSNITGTEYKWKSNRPVKGTPRYSSAPPIMTRNIPAHIRGLVTLCVRVVASVQYADLRPKKPCKSITVTAPRPIIKPANKINKESVYIYYFEVFVMLLIVTRLPLRV